VVPVGSRGRVSYRSHWLSRHVDQGRVRIARFTCELALASLASREAAASDIPVWCRDLLKGPDRFIVCGCVALRDSIKCPGMPASRSKAPESTGRIEWQTGPTERSMSGCETGPYVRRQLSAGTPLTQHCQARCKPQLSHAIEDGLDARRYLCSGCRRRWSCCLRFAFFCFSVGTDNIVEPGSRFPILVLSNAAQSTADDNHPVFHRSVVDFLQTSAAASQPRTRGVPNRSQNTSISSRGRRTLAFFCRPRREAPPIVTSYPAVE